MPSPSLECDWMFPVWTDWFPLTFLTHTGSQCSTGRRPHLPGPRLHLVQVVTLVSICLLNWCDLIQRCSVSIGLKPIEPYLGPTRFWQLSLTSGSCAPNAKPDREGWVKLLCHKTEVGPEHRAIRPCFSLEMECSLLLLAKLSFAVCRICRHTRDQSVCHVLSAGNPSGQ